MYRVSLDVPSELFCFFLCPKTIHDDELVIDELVMLNDVGISRLIESYDGLASHTGCMPASNLVFPEKSSEDKVVTDE